MSDPVILWNPASDRGEIGGGGDEGRLYLVEPTGGERWRWSTGKPGRPDYFASGAHESDAAAMRNAEAYETKIVEENMAKRRKKDEQTKAAATEANGEAPPANANGEAAAPPPPYVERFEHTQDLLVELEAEERVELRSKLVETTCERVELEEQAAVLREKIKGLKERETKYADELKAGKKKHKVKCVERFYVESNRIDTVRKDTGEIIDTRTATQEDRQLDLEDQEAEARGDDEVPDGEASGDDGPRTGDIEDPENLFGDDQATPTPDAGA